MKFYSREKNMNMASSIGAPVPRSLFVKYCVQRQHFRYKAVPQEDPENTS